MSLSKPRLDFFQLTSLPKNGGAIIISGPTYSGKTSIALDILASLTESLNYATAFSPTETFSPCFTNHLPKSFVHEKLNEAVFNQILNYHKIQFKKDPSLRMAFVLDDCMSDTDFMKWKGVKDLFYTARHLGIYLILITQHIMLIPACFRNNSAVLVFTKNPSDTARRAYHQQFFSSLGTFSQFDKVFQFYTSENRVLCLNCRKLSYNPLHNISYYKSNSFVGREYKRQFKIGNPKLHEFLDTQNNCLTPIQKALSFI